MSYPEAPALLDFGSDALKIFDVYVERVSYTLPMYCASDVLKGINEVWPVRADSPSVRKCSQTSGDFFKSSKI